MADMEAMANELVESLFVNGGGDVAERLVLTDAAKRDLGGWCRGAIRDRVLALLSRVDAEATERAAKACDTYFGGSMVPNEDRDLVRGVARAIRSTLPTPAALDALGPAEETETRS